MATYRFEQFKTEITDPIVTANPDTITLKATQMKFDVDILLETPGAKFGVRLENISAQNLSYEGYDNLMTRVMEKLQEYAV
jgi:hypothetical protein